MSNPYPFSQPERLTSPLDQKPAPAISSSLDTSSFKTDVTRNKTRKWVEAKSASYGGDDWGDYDPLDEYGVEQPPALPTQKNNPTSPAGAASLAGPVQSALHRKPSFEQGDERRVFSAGSQPAATHAPESSQRIVSGSSTAPTETSEASMVNPENRRDFTPTALPAPLQTTTVNAPVTSPLRSPESTASSGVRSPSTGVYDPRSTTPNSSTKALPFIRPADIYKRMEEAREQERRASLESSNSGADESSRGRPGSSASMQKTSLERLAQDHARAEKPPLASVPERRSEYGTPEKAKPQTVQTSTAQAPAVQAPAVQAPAVQAPSVQAQSTQPQPVLAQAAPSKSTQSQNPPSLPATRQSFDLPKYGIESAFSDDFWGSTPPISDPTVPKDGPSHVSTVSPTSLDAPTRNPSQGFRTMVNNAFHPSDSSGISKQDSIKSYGTSAGASDISPILNPIQESPDHEPNVMHLQAQEAKGKGAQQEPSLLPANLGGSTVGVHAPQSSASQKPFTMKPLPIPGTNSPRQSMERPVSRDEILQPPPRLGSRPSSPATSPSKIGPRDHTLHLGDKGSRRSSVISVGSKTSAAEYKMAESPHGQVAEIVNPKSATTEQSKGQPKEEPNASTDIKRRPSMPGQFDSYALAQSELPTPAPDPHPMHVLSDRAFAERDEYTKRVETPELAPTTAVRKLEGKDASTGAMAGLAAAGAAMGAAIRRSLSKDQDNKPLPSTHRETGDVLSNRPLAPQRIESEASQLSTIPQAPPKDDPTPPPVPMKPNPLVPSAKKSPATDSPVHGTAGTAGTPSGADWLRDEIDRSLTPLSGAAAQHPHGDDHYTVSPVSPEAHPSDAGPGPKLSKKFSWEESDISSSASQLDILKAADQNSKESERPITPDNARLNGDGLHVINSQPGELPKNATDPTFNQIDETIEDPEATPKNKGKGRALETAALGGGVVAAGAALAASTGTTPSKSEQLPVPPMKDISDNKFSPTTPTSPATPQKDLLSFREIQAIKSTPDRIATYNATRTKWAGANEGLDNWINATLARYPEHESIKQGAAMPLMGSSYRPTGTGSDPLAYSPDTPHRDKRTSAGAGKSVAEGLRGLGGKGKGLLERMGRGRLRGSDGVGN